MLANLRRICWCIGSAFCRSRIPQAESYRDTLNHLRPFDSRMIGIVQELRGLPLIDRTLHGQP
jgi:hypothetical protein